MPARSPSGCGLRGAAEMVLPVAGCRPGTTCGRASPQGTPGTIRGGQATTERGCPVEPLERLLEIAEALVRLGTIEGRLDELLVPCLMRYALVPRSRCRRGLVRRGAGRRSGWMAVSAMGPQASVLG